MRILPVINTQKIQKTSLYKQHKQSQVSFQAVKAKTVQSMDIFNMEAELKAAWNDKKKFQEVLDKYANIDINSKNWNGDTIVTKALKERNSFFRTLINLEKDGKIKGIDWNVIDSSGDNLLMIAFKMDDFNFWNDNLSSAINLANEGKIDTNYVNTKKGYSLPQHVISLGALTIDKLFKLKNLDVTKDIPDRHKPIPILNFAIDKAVFPDSFLELACHPSLDLSKYNINDLLRYINNAPYKDYNRSYDNNERKALDTYRKDSYKKAIETAIKVHNSRKASKYYDTNGQLTLNQIIEHINNVLDERAINMPLNNIGETIAHFLAETYVNPNDRNAIQQVRDVIDKMRRAGCYFWKEDELGRSPLMLAFEGNNLVVARAMLEKMRDSELKYVSLSERGSLPINAIKDSKINHIPTIWNMIADLDLKDRQEFGKLFIERIKNKW